MWEVKGCCIQVYTHMGVKHKCVLQHKGISIHPYNVNPHGVNHEGVQQNCRLLTLYTVTLYVSSAFAPLLTPTNCTGCKIVPTYRVNLTWRQPMCSLCPMPFFFSSLCLLHALWIAPTRPTTVLHTRANRVSGASLARRHKWHNYGSTPTSQCPGSNFDCLQKNPQNCNIILNALQILHSTWRCHGAGLQQ